MAKEPILLLGATSVIARAMAAAFAQQGYPLYLAGRDLDELARIQTDLTIRYNVSVMSSYFDAEALASHADFFTQTLAITAGLSGVVQAFGYLSTLPPGAAIVEDLKTINVNFTGALSILNLCADYFAAKSDGFIIGISSVAGDRGRQSNYIYGASKGALSLYLQGLRNKHNNQVKVITIKLGFVDTCMTFNKPNIFLAASPALIGKKIAAAINTQRAVIYLPWFWFYIMTIIKLIPEKIFKRLYL